LCERGHGPQRDKRALGEELLLRGSRAFEDRRLPPLRPNSPTGAAIRDWNDQLGLTNKKIANF
jgi:hypothetical protein